MTIFSGANGPLNGAGSVCGVTNLVGVAAKSIGDDPAAGPARVRVRRSGVDVVFVNRRSVGDFSVEALTLGLTCGIGDVEVRNEAVRGDDLGARSTSAPRDGAAVLVGAGVLEAVGAELSPDAAGDPSLGTAAVRSVSEAPPVLCATPVGGSDVADESAEDGLPVAADVVDAPGADDELEEVPDGLLLSVDEEPDGVDELEDDELESDGTATATPGMVATAEPTPSAIANAPTRPTHLT